MVKKLGAALGTLLLGSVISACSTNETDSPSTIESSAEQVTTTTTLQPGEPAQLTEDVRGPA